MYTKLRLYWHTVRHLRFVQIRYQLWYRLRRYWRQFTGWQVHYEPRTVHVSALSLKPSIPHPTSYRPRAQAHRFTFLNLTHHFPQSINWNYAAYGKLWTYNLNYFEFLHQPDLAPEAGLALLHTYVADFHAVIDGREPFPTSLRIINWIKFLVRHQLADPVLEEHLLQQIALLRDQLEYHLLGNHLLENAFALLFGAIYTQDELLFAQAQELLTKELDEQILPDGGHFERSPMYHQLILYRLLDSINLLTASPVFSEPTSLLDKLGDYAVSMLGWLRSITLPNGQIPLLNDSAPGIAPTTNELLDYGQRLGYSAAAVALGASGYRQLTAGKWQLIADVGPVGPDYIPGHAHSDTLSFVLYYGKQAVVIDPGISTYEKNKQRQWERSTAAHNTVQIDALEQTEVWGGFRVARRARATILVDEARVLSATHNGYHPYGVTHQRSWQLKAEGLRVTDQITGQGQRRAVAYFHLPPDCNPQQVDRFTVRTRGASFHFQEPAQVKLASYLLPQAYNRLREAPQIVVTFAHTLKTEIRP